MMSHPYERSAFPDGHAAPTGPGLTVQQYFVAEAMKGLLSNMTVDPDKVEWVASTAVAAADAVMRKVFVQQIKEFAQAFPEEAVRAKKRGLPVPDPDGV